MSVLKGSQHLKIPLKDIEIATQNFQHCIGKGGYGMVYKGELSFHGNPTTVAVKRLIGQFGQGLKEFLMEIQLTSQHHPNLISLLGYCDEGKEKIIVYEYAEHGSLDQYLKRSNTEYSLNWLERLKICVDAARGLDHLHNHAGKHQAIIHRDIKSSNILLDHNWIAKVSDLGLSKLSLTGLNRSFVISHVCGTHGYCEPEYFSTGIVTKKSDVYSFGMVLFEVFCGRLCFTMDDGFLLSAPVLKDYYKNKNLDKIVDPALSEQMSFESMNKFSFIAYQCLHDDRAQRPSMNLVKKELDELLKLEAKCLETSESAAIEYQFANVSMLENLPSASSPAWAGQVPSPAAPIHQSENAKYQVDSFHRHHPSDSSSSFKGSLSHSGSLDLDQHPTFTHTPSYADPQNQQYQMASLVHSKGALHVPLF